jgi:hypothetical protein
MRRSAPDARLLVLACVLAACAKSGPSPEEQRAADERRSRELSEEIERTTAPYRRTVEAFFGATSKSDFDAAYALLAPTYTNMIDREAFATRMKTNENFRNRVDVEIINTRAQAGTTRVRCILRDLGLADIDFATASGSPKISSIQLGGMQALPSPN